MMKMVSPAAFILLIILNVGLVAAQCSKPPVIFNFGDSNSDSGGSAALLGGPFAHPDGRTYFNRPTGRLCDGRLMIDFLCESLHTQFLTPFTEPVERNFSNGVNFALIRRMNAAGETIFIIFAETQRKTRQRERQKQREVEKLR